jgi:hypothetical protein
MSVLGDEITNDPTGKGYVSFLPDQPGHVVDLLNAKTETMYKSRLVTGRTILAECGAFGPGILSALDAASVNNEAVKWAVKFLGNDGGLDVGHTVTHATIDQLVNATVLTAEQGQALKDMSLQPASRAEVLGLSMVTEEMLRNR